jgi:hypothetical protein
MPAPAKNLATMSARAWEIKWKTETIGWTKDCDPSGIKLLEREKRVGELNDILIDIETYGLEGAIKMTLHEVDAERIRQLMPWAAATGGFQLAPTAVDGDSQYARAGLLTMHPKGDAGVTNDINILKAFPKVSLPKGGGGKVWKELQIEWTFFPDQAALVATTPTIVYGYIGATPT